LRPARGPNNCADGRAFGGHRQRARRIGEHDQRPRPYSCPGLPRGRVIRKKTSSGKAVGPSGRSITTNPPGLVSLSDCCCRWHRARSFSKPSGRSLRAAGRHAAGERRQGPAPDFKTRVRHRIGEQHIGVRAQGSGYRGSSFSSISRVSNLPPARRCSGAAEICTARLAGAETRDFRGVCLSASVKVASALVSGPAVDDGDGRLPIGKFGGENPAKSRAFSHQSL